MRTRPIALLLFASLATAPSLVSAFGPASASAQPPDKVPAEKGSAGEARYATFRIPLFSDDAAPIPVARVEDEVIILEELNETLAGTHTGRKGDTAAGGFEFAPLLDRLLDLRLIVLEAREMGLDELPAVAEPIAQFKEATLRELVKAQVTKDVKPDPVEVQKFMEARTREVKVKSVLLASEEEARWMQGELAAGKPFDALVESAVATRGAKPGGDDFVDPKKLLPEVATVVQATLPGTVSPPVKLGTGFAFLRVDGVRFRDDPAVRREAERASFSRQAEETLRKHYEGLQKRNARSDDKLFKALDFEAPKPGIAALAKDKRVLVRIQGGKSVTVADLAKELEKQFFHGFEDAAKKGRVNPKKAETLERLLYRRLLEQEAGRLRIAEGKEYRRRIAEYERNALFGAFLQKVIAPEIKVGDEEAAAYYDKKKADFTTPALYRLQALAFGKAGDAQLAAEKLRAGTDFGWLRANAAGQLPSPPVVLDGMPLAAEGMEPGLAQALQGARTGDARVWARSEKDAYAVRVVEEIPAAHRPLAEVREEIGKRLFAEKLGASIRDWGARLRKVREVKVYLTRIGS